MEQGCEAWRCDGFRAGKAGRRFSVEPLLLEHSQEWLCHPDRIGANRVRMALRGAGGRRWDWLGARAAGALGLLKKRIAEIGWCIYREVPTRSNQLERLWKTRKIHRAMRDGDGAS